MKFHLFTHGQKPFNCNICSKTFSQKNKLTYHRRTHFGDKPFECSICSRKFTYNQTLKDHFKIMHTDFQVKCEVCLKTYKSKQGLRSHMLRIHKQNFACDSCGFVCTTKLLMQRHVDNVHVGKV
jgi:KRAB domain-containing zinc finger protein